MNPTNDGLYDSNSESERDSMQPQHYNPPGKTTLSYRVGTRATSFNRMLAGLHAQTSLQGKRPLAALNREQRDDAAIALLDAWATVVDVLSFYQERIANEGYLRTATETEYFSVLELTRPLGYKLSPGVAASTFLAFTVEDAPIAPGAVTVPEGTRVQSIPGQGQLPQTFETIEKIEAKAEWNVLKPYQPWIKQSQEVCWDTIALNLKGINTQLQPGDNILLLDAGVQPPSQFGCFTLQTVEPHPQEGYTRITWKQEKQPDEKLNKPQIFAFRQRVALFGYNAPDWNEMSEEVKRKYSPDMGGIFCLPNTNENWEDNWKPISSALKNADVRALVTYKKVILAGTHNGIFRSNDEGKQWMPINKGLTNTDIHSLIVSDRGHLYAGATGGNVFRSTDGGDTWVAIGTGSVTIIEHRVREAQQGATDSKSEEWNTLTTSLPNTVIYSLATYENFLFVGTEQGVFSAPNSGTNWTAKNKGLPHTDSNTSLTSTVVYSLTHYQGANTNNKHYFFVGTDRGVFRSENNGEEWKAVNKGLDTDKENNFTSTVVYSLTHYQGAGANKYYLFVGTDRGVFRSENNGEDWLAVNKVLPNTDSTTNLTIPAVYSLTHNQQPDSSKEKLKLVAATNQGVFCSDDNGDNWKPVNSDKNSNLADKDIRCLTFHSNGDIFAGTMFTGFGATEWPGFTLKESYIDLDANYTKILADSWVVLMNQSDLQTYKVKSVATVSRNEFLQNAKLTRLELETKENLSLFGGQKLRETLVLAQSEPLELFERWVQENSPVEGDKIELEQLVQGLEGKKIIVSGKRMRVKFKGTEGSLIPLDGSPPVKITENESLIAIAPPTKDDNQTKKKWYLKNKWGNSGTIEIEVKTEKEKILLEPAAKNDETVNEIAEIASASHDGERTTLTLGKSLQNIYDRATVTINANIAKATHGETVTDEVLGSGDGTKTHQQFVLKNPPLTYIAASTPSGSKSTLSVWVDNVLWHEVPSLYGLDPHSRSYTLHSDRDGKTILMFGDGHSGARLPSGDENIRATYRSGIGLDGEVAPGSLTVLQTGPLEIREVINPLPATGSAPRETPRQIRVKAPLSVKAIERIISLQDLEDFTNSFGGIGKAQLRVLETGTSRQIVHLTIADDRGAQVNSKLLVNLRKEIDALCAPTQRLAMASKIQIDNCDRLLFNLEAKIRVAPDYQAVLVLAEIKTDLAAAFVFERREFGQSVTAAEIAALIHTIRGVVAVKIESLYCINKDNSKADKPQLNTILTANKARLENGKICPAEILLLNSDGLKLEEMKP